MKMAMSDNLDWLESNRFTPDTSVPEWQPNRWMALYWVGVAGMAVCWLVDEWMFGFFLFFTVGWANGWPLGLSFQSVISVVMTGYSVLILMTLATGAGAIIETFAALAGVNEERQAQLFIRWLYFSAAVVLCLSVIMFYGIYAWTWREFPNGYVISLLRPASVVVAGERGC